MKVKVSCHPTNLAVLAVFKKQKIKLFVFLNLSRKAFSVNVSNLKLKMKSWFKAAVMNICVKQCINCIVSLFGCSAHSGLFWFTLTAFITLVQVL